MPSLNLLTARGSRRVTLLTGIAYFAGCGESPVEAAPEVVAALRPMGVGYTWTYDVAHTLPEHTDAVTLTIVGEVPGEPGTFVEEVSLGGAVLPVRSLWAHRPDGLWLVGLEADGERFRDEARWLKHPAQVGESFAHERLTLSWDRQIQRHTSTMRRVENADFDTPLGTFRTQVYSQRVEYDDVLAANYLLHYYAAGVGLVGAVVIDSIDGEQREHIRYTLRRAELQ